MAFPTNPTNGQIAVINNVNYQYDSTTKSWTKLTAGTTPSAGSSSSVSASLLPSANVTYDLGSPTQRFRSLYLSGNTIDLNGTTMKVDNNGNIAFIPQSGTGFEIGRAHV